MCYSAKMFLWPKWNTKEQENPIRYGTTRWRGLAAPNRRWANSPQASNRLHYTPVLRGCPEPSSCGAARTVSQPLRFTKVPVLWGVGSGGLWLVVQPTKDGVRDSRLAPEEMGDWAKQARDGQKRRQEEQDGTDGFQRPYSPSVDLRRRM
mgnify:CR=1 FL=1